MSLAVYLTTLMGALIITLLVSRLVRWILKRRPEPSRSLIAAAITALLAVILAAQGAADGGPWKFGAAFATYVPAVIVWLVVDLVRARGKAAVAAQKETAPGV